MDNRGDDTGRPDTLDHMTTAHPDQRRLDDLFARFGPVVHITDIDACGVSRTSIRRLEVQDEIVRIGKSAFAPG